MTDIELGFGNKIISDIHNHEEGWAGFCVSHGNCPVGEEIYAGKTDIELGAFLRIRTSNPDSLDVIIEACERAKSSLANMNMNGVSR